MPDPRLWFRSLSARVQRRLRYLFSILLALVFLVLAFRGANLRSVLDSLRSANYLWVLASVVPLMVSHLLRALRWRYLLDPIKRKIGLRNLFSGVMVGYFFNNILPRAGELARPYALAKLESLPKGAAFGTIVVERIMDTLSFLILVLLLPLIYRGPQDETFPWLAGAGAAVGAVTAMVLVMLVVLMIRRDWTDRLLRILTRLLPSRGAQRVERVLHSFLDGFLFLKHPKKFLVIGVLSALIWTLYGAMTYAAFLGFDQTKALGLRAAFVVLAIASIGVAIPTPGGTGTYHAFVSQTLLRLFAVDGAAALGYATVTHAAMYISTGLVGLYFVVRDHLRVSEVVPGENGGDAG
jgi:uncharacterized protein (TIRG00374 family)